eukprot:764912-Hanusia_phi.AAC.4
MPCSKRQSSDCPHPRGPPSSETVGTAATQSGLRRKSCPPVPARQRPRRHGVRGQPQSAPGCPWRISPTSG